MRKNASNSPDSQHSQDGLDGLNGGLEGSTSLALEEARHRYGNHVTADDLWHYIYGTLHAPDLRYRFDEELKNSAPRFPWVPTEHFTHFRDAGEELMSLHADYDVASVHPSPVLEIDEPEEGEEGTGEGVGDLKVPPGGMRWGKLKKGGKDLATIEINERTRLTAIPLSAHDYQVAGYSPLQWAVLHSKHGNEAGEDFNADPRWVDNPENLIAYLRRLTYVGTRTAEIIGGLPPSLENYEEG